MFKVQGLRGGTQSSPLIHQTNQPLTPKGKTFYLTAASLKWKVGAWSIQGLPLCPASPQIEYSPHGWQIPATQPWAPIPGTRQHWLDQWRGGGIISTRVGRVGECLKTTAPNRSGPLKKPGPKLHWKTRRSSCNVPREPALVRLTAGRDKARGG